LAIFRDFVCFQRRDASVGSANQEIQCRKKHHVDAREHELIDQSILRSGWHAGFGA
jgi:hypothetical protein